jgi:phage nucleotide-binding protein
VVLDLSKIKKQTDVKTQYNVLIYGDPGVGKTTLAAGAPKPILVDIERGGKVLLRDPHLRDIPTIEPDTFVEVEELFWAAKKGELPYDTFILDSLSEFQRRHLDELLIKAAKDQKRPNREYLAEQQDYRLSTEMMRRLVLMFRDLPQNLVVIAHAIEEKDDYDGKMTTRPSVTPKLAGTVIGMMDVVVYLEADFDRDGKFKNKAYVSPTKKIQAKNRLGMSGTIESPSWVKITGQTNNTPKGE